jgi:hypothetical protein
MGASVRVHRQYTAVLVLSVIIQLALFFIACSVGLWIDQLANGSISRLSRNSGLYKSVLHTLPVPPLPQVLVFPLFSSSTLL